MKKARSPSHLTGTAPSSAGESPAAQTQSGAILGTPSYMAPEQAEGKSRQIGTAVGVYALGAILYECLTGLPPFKAAPTYDALLRVVSDDPAWLAAR